MTPVTLRVLKATQPEAVAALDELLRGSEHSPADFKFFLHVGGQIEARGVYADPLVWDGKEWKQ